MRSVSIIQASARSDGDTSLLTNYLRLQNPSWDFFDLSDLNIGHYDYAFNNSDDDFLPTIKQLIHYQTLIMVSPVYWYSMSGRLKVFLDRISDLLDDPHKELGRKLRGKTMVSLSCSRDPAPVRGYEMPFQETAQYLGMDYLGHYHGWVKGDQIPPDTRKILDLLTENTNQQ